MIFKTILRLCQNRGCKLYYTIILLCSNNSYVNKKIIRNWDLEEKSDNAQNIDCPRLNECELGFQGSFDV